MSAQAVAVIGAVLACGTGVALVFQPWRESRADSGLLRPPLLLSVSALSWAVVAGVVAAAPARGGTYLVLALALSASLALAAALSRARLLSLRMRNPRTRLGLDGLLTGTAITLSLWFVVVGPRLVEAPEARRILTAVLLVLTWSTAALAGLQLTLVRSRRSVVFAMLTSGGALGATDIACAWPLATLSDSDALLIAAGGLIVAASRVTALFLVAGPLRLGLPLDRPAPSTHAAVGHDADAAGIPTPRELSPSTIASVVVTVVLILTMLFYPVPPRQLVPLALVVLLMIVFSVREYLSVKLREQLTGRLRRQALTDPLTGLTNRRGLSEWLTWVGGRNNWTVVTVDVDGFKQVNELLGYDTADGMLADAGTELAAVDPPALACRLGGDEFVVIAPGDLTDGLELAEDLRLRLGRSLQAAAFGVPVTASFGVGRMPESDENDTMSTDPLWVLGESAAALRAAKARAGDQVVAFFGDVAVAHVRQQRIEGRLRAMVSQRAVGLSALPVVDLTSGRIEGIEALARWDDKILGPISPADFVPIAERRQLMQPLGEQILQRALEEMVRLTGPPARGGHNGVANGVTGGVPGGAAGDPEFSLTVNLSLAQLRRPDFVEFVADSLQRANFPASRLVVDVRETTLLSEDGVVSAALIMLAELGVKIAVDDFGTGYLALSCLQWLPVHTLKVDRRLTEAPGDPRTLAVVEAVIQIAHEIGMHVVMEGVSTPQLARYWRDAGADAGQGYALAPPSPWATIGSLVRDGVELGAS